MSGYMVIEPDYEKADALSEAAIALKEAGQEAHASIIQSLADDANAEIKRWHSKEWGYRDDPDYLTELIQPSSGDCYMCFREVELCDCYCGWCKHLACKC